MDYRHHHRHCFVRTMLYDLGSLMPRQKTYANDEDMLFNRSWKLLWGKKSRAKNKRLAKKKLNRRERHEKIEEE